MKTAILKPNPALMFAIKLLACLAAIGSPAIHVAHSAELISFRPGPCPKLSAELRSANSFATTTSQLQTWRTLEANGNLTDWYRIDGEKIDLRGNHPYRLETLFTALYSYQFDVGGILRGAELKIEKDPVAVSGYQDKAPMDAEELDQASDRQLDSIRQRFHGSKITFWNEVLVLLLDREFEIGETYELRSNEYARYFVNRRNLQGLSKHLALRQPEDEHFSTLDPQAFQEAADKYCNDPKTQAFCDQKASVRIDSDYGSPDQWLVHLEVGPGFMGVSGSWDFIVDRNFCISDAVIQAQLPAEWGGLHATEYHPQQ